MGSIAQPSGGKKIALSELYYDGIAVSDSYGTFASCGVRAHKDNTNPSAVSGSHSFTVPLFKTKNNTDGLLTSITIVAHAYSHYNDTTSRGSASANITVKTPQGTTLGSASISSSGNNDQRSTVIIDLSGKTALVTENCTYVVVTASTSASASVTYHNENSWTQCNADCSLTSAKYLAIE